MMKERRAQDLESRIIRLASAHKDPYTVGPTFLFLSRKLKASYDALEEAIDSSGAMDCNVAIQAGGHGWGIAELPRGEWTVELDEPNQRDRRITGHNKS